MNLAHDQTVTILGEWVSNGNLKKNQLDEKEAIFTHFLHNTSAQVPFLEPEQKSSLAELLKPYEKAYENYHNSFPFPPKQQTNFKFIDLFAGIGGFRIAMQNLGGSCVFSSEWDKAAKQTYYRNFGEVPFGDIRMFTAPNISDEEISQLIPDHDVLCAGFPCQPFSRAGVSARNSLGVAHGFLDENQGNLFFDIVRIVKAKRPKVLFLENVKNLKSHDNGKTFEVIKNTIEELGYSFSSKIIDARSVVPQKRQRCYMIAIHNDNKGFEFPSFEGDELPLKSILEKRVSSKYTISDKLWAGHQKRTKRNLKRGTGFTALEADLVRPANTLVARYYKDGKECLVPQRNKNPRKLTPREAARLMGFPDTFVVADTASTAYRQFGNSLVVPVVEKIGAQMITHPNVKFI